MPPISNALRCDVALTPHPYPGPSAHLEAWGSLALAIVREGTMPPFTIPSRVELFTTQWDLAEFATWVAATQVALNNDRLPKSVDWPAILPHESLAQALLRLADRAFADDQEEEQDRWHDALYQYRTRHMLRFAMRGARCPAIVIGSRGGHGEVSHAALLGEDSAGDEWSFLGTWAYTFAMNDFLADVSHQLVQALTRWAADIGEPTVHARARSIIVQLGKRGL